MACDLCGKKEGNLYALHDQYKTEDVQHICDSCKKAVDKHLKKLQNVSKSFVSNVLKDFIGNLKKEKSK